MPLPALIAAAPVIGSALGKLFGGLFGGANPEKTYKKALDKYLKTGQFDPNSGFGKQIVEMQRQQQQEQERYATSKAFSDQAGGFYKKLIPGSFDQLSAPVAAQRDMELDAAVGSANSARVGGFNQLNQKFGGRVPASIYASFMGNLARGTTQDRTNIGRNAAMRNVELGETGASGLAALAGGRAPSASPTLGFSNLSLPGGAQGGAASGTGAAAAGLGQAGFAALLEWLLNRKKPAYGSGGVGP